MIQKLESKLERNFKCVCIILFLLGLIICFFRSTYLITIPQIYAEDGVWSSLILTKGFLWALLHARDDYFVFGNLFMLKAALMLNKIFNGLNLEYLPYIITFIQWAFFSLVAILPVITLRKSLSFFYRLCIWILILLVPLGDTGYEIFGKILNVGYLFYFVAFNLLFYRVTNFKENLTIKSKILIFIIDIVLILCCTTNPTCYVLVGCAFIFSIAEQILQNGFKKLLNYENISFFILQVVLTAIKVIENFVLSGNKWQNADEYNLDNFIEYSGRSIIFYFIHPFYKMMDNNKIIVILLALLIILAIAFIKLNKTDRRNLSVSTLSTLLLFSITVVARPFLLNFLNNYTTSFPDRYYYGLNIMTLILIFFAVSILIKQKSKFLKAISCGIILILLINPFINLKTTFEFDKPILKFSAIPFKERVYNAYKNSTLKETEHGYLYNVKIEPDPDWSIEIPPHYVEATVNGNNER